ncbi:MAG: trypsin-like serine protease [Bdellovibrionaceae bacterium]|jgi:hypothetical protein|nr:trypsin-like serine protease [Pseudobdellovibrionaceae bacterium]
MKKKWMSIFKTSSLLLPLGLTLSCQRPPEASLLQGEAQPLETQNAYFSDQARGEVYPSDGDMKFFHMAVPVYKGFSSKNPSSVGSCSSVVIAPTAILTSAHCIHASDDVKEVWFTTNSLNPKYVVWKARVRQVVIHPEYEKTTHPVDKASYDLAVVFFHHEDLPQQALKYQKMLRLADPSQVKIEAHTVFSFLGWGSQSGSWEAPVNDGQMRRLALPGEVSLNRNGEWIVITNTTRTWRLCSGDSGGPLVYLAPSKKKSVKHDYLVVGIFSQVARLEPNTPEVCENFRQMRFTSILPHRQWIIDTVMNDSLDYLGSNAGY